MEKMIGLHERFHYRNHEELRVDLERLGLALPFSEDLSILARPLKLGGRQAPNRFVVHPMEGFDAAPDGSPRELTFRRYKRYAAGGSGLIWFEATAVLQEARSNPGQLFLHPGNLSVFAALVEAVKHTARETRGHEPLLVLQLTHSGRYSKPGGLPAPLIAHHSPILDPLHRLAPDYPLVTDAYLDRLQDIMVEAAGLAAAAGFDGVDIKSCHRYLLSELLASFTRTGKYGGSFENRTRMLREVCVRIGAEVPGVFPTARLNICDGIPYPYGFGMQAEEGSQAPDTSEAISLARTLHGLGIPVLNLTMGNPYYIPHFNRPFDFPVKGAPVPDEHPLTGIARFLEMTRIVQQGVLDLPMIGTGYAWLRHLMPEVAAGTLKTGGAAMIGQGRGAFAYPDSVRDILDHGRMDPAKCCVACSACTQIMRDGGKTGCVVRDSATYGPQYRLGRRFDLDHLREEAGRCRICQEPSCRGGCPTGVDIPAFLREFAVGRIAEAYAILKRANVLPEMCGWVCPAEAQCEGGCLERVFCGSAIPIKDIQLATARTARLLGLTAASIPDFVPNGKVAVIGGGPAGVACAIKLLETGHKVTIFEKYHRLGGTPDRLIPRERYDRAAEEIGAVLAPALSSGRLDLRFGRSLGEDLRLAEVRAEYDAVFLAVGLCAPQSLGGGPGVHDALTFLRLAKEGAMTAIDGGVAVVGGGSTATDAAMTARRLGAVDVFLLYRRSYLEMPAWEEERTEVLGAGIHLLLLTQPLGYVCDANGRLTGVRIVRTALDPPESSGRRRPRPLPDSESVLPVGMVIEAIGQEAPSGIRAELRAVGVNQDDGLALAPGSTATAVVGIYAGGDLVNGGQTAAKAVADGMRAAGEIAAYLEKKVRT